MSSLTADIKRLAKLNSINSLIKAYKELKDELASGEVPPSLIGACTQEMKNIKKAILLKCYDSRSKFVHMRSLED